MQFPGLPTKSHQPLFIGHWRPSSALLVHHLTCCLRLALTTPDPANKRMDFFRSFGFPGGGGQTDHGSLVPVQRTLSRFVTIVCPTVELAISVSSAGLTGSASGDGPCTSFLPVPRVLGPPNSAASGT